MIDKSVIQATSSWPFVEARKLVKERQKIYEKKGKITLQTGYGPSGLPHIGTFAEVARTTMLVNAINQIIDIPRARVRPMRAPSRPKRKPPTAAPNKKAHWKYAYQLLTVSVIPCSLRLPAHSAFLIRSSAAGCMARLVMPIWMPPKNHPRKATTRMMIRAWVVSDSEAIKITIELK